MNWLSFLKKSSYIMLALMLGFASCSKNEDIAITEINPLDPDGANNNNTNTDTTVDIAVSGQITMDVGGTDWSSDFASATSLLGTLSILGTKSNEDGIHEEAISLLSLADTVGSYEISSTSQQVVNYSIGQTTNYVSNYSSDLGGHLSIIEIDTVNKIVSGTFSITLVNPSTSETKIISNGVFTDIAY